MALHADALVLMAQGRVVHQGLAGDPATHRAVEQVFDRRLAIHPVADAWVGVPR